MQQSRRPVQRRSGFSGFFGTRLMILLLLVAAIVVAVFVFRATRATSTAAPPAHTAGAGSKDAGRGVHSSRPQTRKTPKALTPSQLRARAMNTQRKRYAARIVPVLDRSTRIFDAAARGAASANGNFDALQQTCTSSGGKAVSIEGQYEGIPHPYAWWTPAGTLHHKVSGVYHYMLGAIQNCQEAVQATDSDSSSAAVSEMATAAANLHNEENYARYLATH